MNEDLRFQITYQATDKYSLHVNGIDAGTGDLHTVTCRCESIKAKTKCTLFPDAYNPDEPTRMPKECIGKDCTKCGWNPDVAEKRLKKAGLK